MLELMLFTPIALSVMVFFARSRLLNIAATMLYAVLFAVITVMLCMKPASFTAYFRIDSLNIVFLLVLAVLFAGTAVYNIDFLINDAESVQRQAFYTIYLLLFVASMAGVILSTHLALLWVFVEATTLSSSYLIYYHRSETTVEAAWKYLFICSVGIAIAFVGITLLSMGLGGTNSFFFDDLVKNAGSMNPFWLKLSFPFILVGFGTKAGFAPVHAWLPDAHSESPSPVSALLSGALLNAALLGIIRINKVMELAGMGWYVKILLLLVGFLSLFVTAVYMGVVRNYKRMLAYSSIENMGIIMIGLGAGGAGLFAAVLHLVSHSLAKGSLFLTSGNILHRYRTKEVDGVRGMLKSDATTGWLWIFSIIAIVGLPPFPIFISEFFIVKALFQNGQYSLAVLFFLFLTIVMAGMTKNALRMSFGDDNSPEGVRTARLAACVPQAVFLLLLFMGGIALPDIIRSILQAAADIL